MFFKASMVISSVRWLWFISHIVINLLVFTVAQPEPLEKDHYCIDSGGNYTTNTTYRTNLDTALTFILSNTNISYGFYNFSVGQNPDKVTAIALCRGDVEADKCRSCVRNSTLKLRQSCPNQKEAIGWYPNCMVRYSDRSILGTVETSPGVFLYDPTNASDAGEFNQDLRTLLDSLRGQAARGGSLRKFATGSLPGPGFLTIYGAVQCTPDLSGPQCGVCLDNITRDIPIILNGKLVAGIYRPSCYIGYGLTRFYNDTPADAPPPPAHQPPPIFSGKDDNTARTVTVIVVPTTSSVIVLVCICVFLRKTKQRKRKEKFEKVEDIISTEESMQYDFGTISAMTRNFSDINKLGEGGFGAVYKGNLPNGEQIAVKRLSTGSRQGELEFKNEVTLMAKLQHRNLVRFLGFCLEGAERILIYEFVANASLDHFIFDPIKRAYLDWDRRYKIILGVARGLLYLHEDSRLRVIHRDLKASNILLDDEMNPKISDFGMAKLFSLDETHGNTKRIVGTFGYMAPEYVMDGQFSMKSDVFSFGVLVLEIITGQKNRSFRNGEKEERLLCYAWKSWQEGTSINLIDPTLRAHSSSIHDILRCFHVGLLCVQENVADRPPMASILLMLNSFNITLPVPLEPAFFVHSSIDRKMPLPGENNSMINMTSITELYPR